MKNILTKCSIFISRNFWNYYLHPCQKSYAIELAKCSKDEIIWIDPPTRNPLTWLKSRKFKDSSGVSVYRPFATNREYESFSILDRILFWVQLVFIIPISKRPNLWSIACPQPWLMKSKFFAFKIYWPGDFFEPKAEYELYKHYDLLMTWTPKGIEQIPKAFNGYSFKTSTCPGDAFTFHERNVKEPSKFASRAATYKQPYIIYVGGLSSRRVDFEILQFLAQKLPSYSLILAAKPDGVKETFYKVENLLKNKNVTLLDDLNYEELPYLVNNAHVGIVPYLVNFDNSGICPNKIFEYASLGVPIVSTAIPAIFDYSPPVMIAKNKDMFLSMTKEQLTEPKSEELSRKLKIMAKNSTPRSNIERIRDLIS
jgi:glycosyltransferase involved in cell wall biosynthesis